MSTEKKARQREYQARWRALHPNYGKEWHITNREYVTRQKREYRIHKGSEMGFRVEVTVNYPNGREKHINCHPTNLFNLKKIVAMFVTAEPAASSFVFTVCVTHKETGEDA